MFLLDVRNMHLISCFAAAKASLPPLTGAPASSPRMRPKCPWLLGLCVVGLWQEELDEIATFSDALRACSLASCFSRLSSACSLLSFSSKGTKLWKLMQLCQVTKHKCDTSHLLDPDNCKVWDLSCMKGFPR